MTCIIGIDPGVSGAIAFIFTEDGNRVVAEDVPVIAGEISAPALAARIRAFAPSVAIIERASAMPKQGVVSMFNYGVSFGQVRGVIGAMNVPLHYVTPGKWKRHFNLSSEKEQSLKLVHHLFPACVEQFKLKKHHGRAEAALIARFGFETLFPVSAAA